jgi:hypothetical protein
MGILAPEKTPATPAARRRRSTGLNFGELKPLTANNTKNFSGYRDPSAQSPKSKKKDEDAMDSDADDEDEVKVKTEDDDDHADDRSRGLLSPEDAVQSGELAEGVRKIKVGFCPDLSYTFANRHIAQTSALGRTDESARLSSKTRQHIRESTLWRTAAGCN